MFRHCHLRDPALHARAVAVDLYSMCQLIPPEHAIVDLGPHLPWTLTGMHHHDACVVAAERERELKRGHWHT